MILLLCVSVMIDEKKKKMPHFSFYRCNISAKTNNTKNVRLYFFKFSSKMKCVMCVESSKHSLFMFVHQLINSCFSVHEKCAAEGGVRSSSNFVIDQRKGGRRAGELSE